MTSSASRPGVSLSVRRVTPLSRRELVAQIEAVEAAEREWIRKQVLEHRRIDILITEVLGYDLYPHHIRLLQHLYGRDPDTGRARSRCMTLIWRGAGKTTVGTVATVVAELLWDPNIRILIGSKSGSNAEAMLSEIKYHFEENQRFIEIFGDLVGTKKWNETEINVANRTKWTKESNVTVIGVEGTVVSKHYDLMIGDDLVDEKNASTSYMRKKTHTFFYKTMLPCLEPEGRLWISGTRYHDEDLFGHFSRHEMRGNTLLIPALKTLPDGTQVSNWEEKFSTAFLKQLRESMGSIIFDSQYQMDTKAMRGGGMISFDDCQRIALEDIPEDLPAFGGTDLASSRHTKADYFCSMVAKYDAKTGRIYVYKSVMDRLSFNEQRLTVDQLCTEEDLTRMALEAVAYQECLFQEVKRLNPLHPVVPIKTRHDKVTRMMRRTPLFEGKQVFFGPGLDREIEQLVAFPDGEHDDACDAFDLLVTAIQKRVKKDRRKVGLF